MNYLVTKQTLQWVGGMMSFWKLHLITCRWDLEEQVVGKQQQRFSTKTELPELWNVVEDIFDSLKTLKTSKICFVKGGPREWEAQYEVKRVITIKTWFQMSQTGKWSFNKDTLFRFFYLIWSIWGSWIEEKWRKGRMLYIRAWLCCYCKTWQAAIGIAIVVKFDIWSLHELLQFVE